MFRKMIYLMFVVVMTFGMFVTANAGVAFVGVDTTTQSNWRTAAALEPDLEYGTDGYVIYGLKVDDAVYISYDASSVYAEPDNLVSLPAYIDDISLAGATFTWSGNGNFGQIEDPANGNAPTNTPLLANGDPDPWVFTITRTTTAAFRLTVMLSNGDNAPSNWITTVDDGGSASHDFTVPDTSSATYYEVFDVPSGSGTVTVTVEYIPDGSQFNVTGFAFDSPSELASNPRPADGATDVPRDVVLSWEPGDFAAPTNGHKVYFSENFNDVNDGIGGITQDANSYTPPQRLDLNTTYYWRVDEVNAPPSSTIFKGDVWSFTVEPFAYPIAGERITATASSSGIDQGPENTVNGSGLDVNDLDLHSTEFTDMWLSDTAGPQPTWIQYEFDKVYKLHQMWVWNHSTLNEPVIGFGVKDGTIEYSLDGANWTTLGTTHEFARGSGAAGYAYNTTVDFGGAAAKYVRLTANSNWGGLLPQYGLSEVRFFSIPVQAREPSPDSEATDVDVDLVLSFRAGREAAEHNVYLSSDEQAVIDGNAPVTTVTETSYGPLSLDVDSTYYWRVDEVNDAETTTMWQGEIWNFSTPEFLVVDDFELYNEIPDGEEGSNLVYLTWIDGYENPSANGSTMGHTVAFEPSMESVTVYDGKQSAPLYYDNSTAGYSEATANVAALQVGQDWTRHGIKALTLRFCGDPNNAVEQMYVKLNGSKVTYDGDAENIRRTGWQMWYIDLASLGVSLSNVTELSIGFERSGAVGGQGVVYFDGIRLYSHDRQLITPVEPNTADLVGHWPLDGNPNNISANGYDGVAEGGVTYGEGVLGQAADFNGSDALIDCGDVPVGDTGAISIAFWVKPRNIAQDWAGYVSKWTLDNSQRTFWLGQHSTDGWLRFGIYPGGPTAETSIDSGQVILANEQWTHIVCTYDGDIQRIYADGVEVVSSPERNAAIVDRGGNLRFGIVATANWFNGLIDDVRLYDRALSEGEVAGLGGVTKPFDKPF